MGTYEQSAGFGFVVPDNQRFLRDIFIQKGNEMGAADKDKVLVKIQDYGRRKQVPGGKGYPDTGETGRQGTGRAVCGEKLQSSYGISGKSNESGRAD